MKRRDDAFLRKHRASLLGSVAVAALLAFLSLQFGLHLSADGLGANQTLKIGIGECKSLNLTISGGFGYSILGATPIGKINLDAVEVPAGVNVSVNPRTGSPFFHSKVTFQACDNSTEGIKEIVISGVGPFGETERLEIDLEVVAIRSFELVGSTAEITMKQNKTASIPVQIIRKSDYAQPITFKALGLPAEIVPTFDPSGSLPGAAQTSLLLKISPETMIGRYNFSVRGTGADNRTAFCNLSLKIEADRYFTISADPSMIEVARGNDSLSTIELIGVNNYTGNIKLGVISYPKDIININIEKIVMELSPSSIKDRTNLKLHANDAATPEGSHNVVVNALGQDGYSANCSILVIIEGQKGSFRIQPQFSSLSLKPGEINISKISIEGIDGYEGTITLGVSDVPGITANIDPNVIFINGQNDATSCQLSVHAQTEGDSASKSDMIISGIDASQNSDDCSIAVSVQNESSATPQNPAKLQFSEPQTAAISANDEPIVEPSAGKPAAAEPSAIKPDDSEQQAANGRGNYDNNVIKSMDYPKFEAASSSENTTSEEFFDEISAKDFNYSRIPIISMSTGTRDRWYRNDPGSANYVGEYEIRKELFYSKSDYTIKLVLDNQSKPVDVIFMQGSNVISEVPTGFLEQAMRKLSSI